MCEVVSRKIKPEQYVLSRVPDTKYFDVAYKDSVVVLKPVQVYDANLETVRAKIKKLGLSDSCVAEAVKWARSKK